MKRTLSKLAILLLATGFLAGSIGPALAGSTDSGKKPAVDCEKKPDDPSCKEKKK